MNTFIIRHVLESDPPKFEIVREDGKTSDSIEVASPFGFPVEGKENSNLIRELPWYLEDYLLYPYPPRTDQAEKIVSALNKWGKQAFDNLFGGGPSGNWFYEAKKKGYKNICLQVMSDDASILQWPWEAMLDPNASYLGVDCCIERRLNHVDDPIEIPEDLPKDRMNILLVTSRPYEQDIKFRSISRPLVELIEKEKIPAYVHVLRPPTFANLRNHLKDNPHYYHIIHFDGHGDYEKGGVSSGHAYTFKGKGELIFEDDDGKPKEISAELLSSLLREHAVPIMVLNACRSAMLDQSAEDPFASVAASLIKAGTRGVVAMSYSLYVSGAIHFLPAFYSELFESGDNSRATRAGRQKMFENMVRISPREKVELRDFMVPVIYQQERYQPPFAKSIGETIEIEKPVIPEEAKDDENPYGFIGRDFEILKLERAMRRDTPAILINGLGGVGKTTLAKGFLKWLANTGGMAGCIWLSFIDIRSAEYVINAMGSRIFGKDFLVVDMDQKIQALAQALRENNMVIIWDNFEVVAGIEGTYQKATLSVDDRNLLLSMLKKIRGGNSKVIITSRSEEDWLGIQRMKVSIGGLIGEDRWEYCDKILGDLGIDIDRDDSNLVALVNLLKGHPLAMKAILPRLEKVSAENLKDAIKFNMEELGGAAEILYATIKMAIDDLPIEQKQLCVPLSIHVQFIEKRLLVAIACKYNKKYVANTIDDFINHLVFYGLLTSKRNGIFEMHPLLASYLEYIFVKSIPSENYNIWSDYFVDEFSLYAIEQSNFETYDDNYTFNFHAGNAYSALNLAIDLNQKEHSGELLQALAKFAKNSFMPSEALSMFEESIQVAKEYKLIPPEALAYHEIGNILKNLGKLNESKNSLLRACKLYDQIEDKIGKANSQYELANVYLKKRIFDLAERLFNESLCFYKSIKCDKNIAAVYIQLGTIAELRSDYPKGKEYCLKALKLSRKHNIDDITCYALNELGIMSLENNDNYHAKKYFSEAYDIAKRLGLSDLFIKICFHIGIIEMKDNKYSEAERSLITALKRAELFGDLDMQGAIFHQLAINAMAEDQYDHAFLWCKKAINIKRELEDSYSLMLSYGEMGQIMRNKGNVIDSGKYFIKALKILEHCNNPDLLKKTKEDFVSTYSICQKGDRRRLRSMWEEADLGPFPEVDDSKDDKENKK